jgi:hypothetical protein
MPRFRAALFFVLILPGCAALLGPVTGRLADDVSTAMLDQDDVETVRDGAPAYLIMVDGFVAGDPENATLLLTAAQLYGAYASAFVDDPARRRRLTDRALGYGLRALCIASSSVCEKVEDPYEEFALRVAAAGASDVPALYGFAAAWAGWVEARSDDWVAVAEIPKIEALMQRVVTLDESYEQGAAHLYLGVLATLRPAALGGEPEEGRRHFERAIALSEGRNLMGKVLYARSYARLVFDRPLHDRLLREVLAADPRAPGLTLSNTLAQQQARLLLDDADDYF